MNENNRSHKRPRTEDIEDCTLDSLVIRASRGDRCAIESIASVYGPRLALDAGVIGSFDQAPEDLVDEFAAALMDAVPRRRLVRSRALPWMLGVLREVARNHRRKRERHWEIASADS